MALLPASIQLGLIRYDVFANRPSPDKFGAGAMFCATDTSTLYQCQLDAAGAKYWMTLSSGGVSVGGLKYLVSNQVDLGAPFLTVQSAIDAAAANGHGTGAPVDIPVLEGPYAENLTLRAGINLVALGVRGAQNATPTVRITGNHAIANVVGPLSIDGVLLDASSGDVLTIGGTAVITLLILRSQISLIGGTGSAINATNSGGGTSVTLCDAFLSVTGAAAAAVTTTTAVLRALRTTFNASTNALVSLALGTASGDTLTDCDVRGGVGKTSGTITARGLHIDMTADISGAATWTIAQDIEAPRLAFQLDATVTPRRVWTPHTRQTLAGAGPFNLDWDLADTIICNPGANVVQVVNLPLLSRAPDGTDTTFTYGPTITAQGAAVVAIVANSGAGNGIGTTGAAPVNALRLYQGGSVVLRAERATGLWQIVSYDMGSPDALDLYVDPATGSDANAGTAALPLATIAAARAAAKASGWAGFGHVNLAVGTYTEPTGSVFAVPGGNGPNAEPLLLLGTASPSGLGTRTASGSTPGSGVTSTWGTVTDSVGGLTVSAWRGWILRLTGAGTFVGREFVVNDNDATTFTVVGTFPAITTETFVIEKPGSLIQTTNNAPVWEGAGGTMLGMRRVEMKSTAAASTWRIRNLKLYHSACWFTDWVGITRSENAGSNTMLVGANSAFPSLATVNACGSSFVSQYANATITMTSASQATEQNCLIRAMRTVVDQASTYSEQFMTHQGDAGVRVARCSQGQISGRMETVTAIAGDYGSAAVVCENGADLFALNLAFASCPGAGVLLSSATAKLQGLQGAAGVTGVPVTLTRGATFRKSLSNTLTGTTAGVDVQVGGMPYASSWATVTTTTGVNDTGSDGGFATAAVTVAGSVATTTYTQVVGLNALAGMYVRVVTGPAIGQRFKILSNTAGASTALTLEAVGALVSTNTIAIEVSGNLSQLCYASS